MKRKAALSRLIAMLLAVCMVLGMAPAVSPVAFADDSDPAEEGLFYFVDCGDYNPKTVSAGDSFGKYNSVTEQAYGADPVTGRRWALSTASPIR